jgi:hypothetical protein
MLCLRYNAVIMISQGHELNFHTGRQPRDNCADQFSFSLEIKRDNVVLVHSLIDRSEPIRIIAMSTPCPVKILLPRKNGMTAMGAGRVESKHMENSI